MHMLERILTNTINAANVGMQPAAVGIVELDPRYQGELERQEERFRQARFITKFFFETILLK